ncbi:Hsp20/alpha crystallin family protein [Desulfomicrobium escambiense]|uniref:Hsp20/alpha crystallin family protein n=1 Tax=Desulfomicrobium escambiense TaxID=29503 RepID=UPI000428D51E|nr:Hsp20/alpha crystallin family protein [Desulfomicrobium escambiense]
MVIDFSSYYDLPRNMDSFFEELWKPSSLSQRRVAYPPVNISESDGEIIVTSEIPGMDTGDIELTLNEKSLIIRGAKKNEVGNYYRQERPTGSFQRIVNLNVPVQADGIKATMKDGLLRVVMPKARESRPLTISIDAQ